MKNPNVQLNANSLRHGGTYYIETLDAKGKVIAVTRFALLHLGEDGRDVIEIRVETKQGKSEHRVEVGK